MTFKFIQEVILGEAKSGNKLDQVKLKYAKGDLDPVISEDTMNYHYGKLYKTYVDRFNSGKGDPEFNEAGAYLHSIYFRQFQTVSTGNKPTGQILEFIQTHFETFENFQTVVEQTAMGIQGSGWVYLSRNGQIKTIKNHSIRSDIVLLIDWWEHAWALDYQADKAGYLKNIWRIIDWPVINERIT